MTRYSLLPGIFILCLLLNVWTLNSARGQAVGQWEAYTSNHTVTSLLQGPEGRTWCATSGGLFAFKDSTVVQHFTTVEGMSSLNPTALSLDRTHNRLFIGYTDGGIDVLDLNKLTFASLDDIKRAERYSPRSVNAMVLDAGRLFVATDFGIVVYRLQDLLVRDSYVQLGRFSRAANVLSLDVAGDTLYAGTSEGIAIGVLKNDLTQPDQWVNYDAQNGFYSQRVTALAHYGSDLYAVTNNANYVFDGQSWSETNQFGQEPVTDFDQDGQGGLGAATESGIYLLNGGKRKSWLVSKGRPANAISVNDAGFIAVGLTNEGLAEKTPASNSFFYYRPDGPSLNFFTGLSSRDGILLSGTTDRYVAGSPLNAAKGYTIFENGKWRNFNELTNPVIDQYNFDEAFTTTITDGYYYVGSWGNGLVRHRREDDQITVYNRSNSHLVGIDSDPNFIVISGLAADAEQGAWAVSLYSDRPLNYQQAGDDQWIPLSKSPAVGVSDYYKQLFIDSYGQKWITLESREGNGRGLLVLDTGDPLQPDDDQAVKLTEDENRGNLPNITVNAVTQDRNGEVWVGTDRGVARYILPDRVINGSAADRRAQWLINDDTTASSPFLLRDIDASAMVVNAANEKWIGTRGDGVWLLNPDGSRVLRHFTTENSPLLSNTIFSLAIDGNTGTVYMATDIGLSAYTDVPRAAQATMKKLRVYPNPFSYKRNHRIIIDDLSEQATIRIVSTDGSLVNKLEARGGRASWNGRDFNGHKVASGVYLVVALDENEGEKGIGKIVIIR